MPYISAHTALFLIDKPYEKVNLIILSFGKCYEVKILIIIIVGVGSDTLVARAN